MQVQDQMEMLTSLMHDQTLRDQVVSMVQFEFLQSLGLQEQADSHPQVGVLIFMYMIYGMLVLAFYALVTTAWYIDMAWWTTFFFPFFSISYLAYWVFAINDLDKAKAILKNVEVWDDEYENQRGKDNKRSRRQDIHNFYLENGSFYIFKAKTFLKEKNRLFGKIGQFEMKKETSFQLDDAIDLKIIRSLI